MERSHLRSRSSPRSAAAKKGGLPPGRPAGWLSRGPPAPSVPAILSGGDPGTRDADEADNVRGLHLLSESILAVWRSRSSTAVGVPVRPSSAGGDKRPVRRRASVEDRAEASRQQRGAGRKRRRGLIGPHRLALRYTGESATLRSCEPLPNSERYAAFWRPYLRRRSSNT